MRWESVHEQDGLEALRPEWSEFFERTSTELQFFQSPEFVQRWWDHMEERRDLKPMVLVARTAHGRLACLWPLQRRRVGVISVLESAGGLMACYDDMLVDPDLRHEAPRSAARFLARQPNVDVLHLRGVHDESCLAQQGGDWQVVGSTAAPWLRTADYECADDYFASRSKRFRAVHRKSLRLLGELGRVEVLRDDPSIPTRDAVELAFTFKRRWLEARGLSGRTILSPRGQKVLNDLCLNSRGCSTGPRCELSTLRLDGEVLAIGIAFVHARRRYEYFGAFDDRFSRFGIGRVQVGECLRACLASDVDAIDFLTPATEFKSRLCDRHPKVHQLIHAMTFAGALYRDAYVKTMRPLLRRAYRGVVALRKFGNRCRSPM